MGGIELQENGEEDCARPVNLVKLDLSGWEGVLLTNAKFSDANLFDANLSGAKLSRAKLSRANLVGANFRGANISGANFTRSTIDNYTNFSDAWAWCDDKPIGLYVDIIFCVFDPEIHQRNIEKRPDSCARSE